jgi:pSer/pThr/pTyr-binding forkhead associated (FHA) protein
MISCPNCKHESMEGSLFCLECGTQLVGVDRIETQSLRSGSKNFLSTPVPVPPTAPMPGAMNGGEIVISLHFIDNGNVVHLTGKNEYILGRKIDLDSKIPDVDLNQFDAFSQGVSRMHACIKVGAGQHVSIIDLGSSNGTRVNGQKVVSQSEFPLNHGDVVALGKLKIQFLIRK